MSTHLVYSSVDNFNRKFKTGKNQNRPFKYRCLPIKGSSRGKIHRRKSFQLLCIENRINSHSLWRNDSYFLFLPSVVRWVNFSEANRKSNVIKLQSQFRIRSLFSFAVDEKNCQQNTVTVHTLKWLLKFKLVLSISLSVHVNYFTVFERISNSYVTFEQWKTKDDKATSLYI